MPDAINVKDLIKEVLKLPTPTHGWECVVCGEFSKEEENKQNT